ncbi:MAG TPA: tetratricopeptide repeat protein [Bacteroidia bacterium]|jgi:tetratricopeptide (TPR) repeat protein|nr:tetratricopeptide repeat protein [Bacteroidia bacterium]
MRKLLLFISCTILFVACTFTSDTSPFYFNQGHIEDTLNHYEQAIEYYTIAINKNSYHPEYYLNRGIDEEHIGKFKSAINDYNKVLQTKSYEAMAYNDRGLAEHDSASSLFSESLRDYDSAIKINPEWTIAYCNRAELESDMGFYQRDSSKYLFAMKDLDKSLALDSKNYWAYCNRGLLNHRLGKYPEALGDFNIAISLNPDIGEFYTDRGVTYMSLHKDSLAKASFIKALKLSPRIAYNNLGFFDYTHGNYLEGKEYYNKLLTIDSSNGQAYLTRGLIELKLNEHEEACQDFYRALKHHDAVAQEKIDSFCTDTKH